MTELLHREAPEVKPKRSKWLIASLAFMALTLVLVVYVLWPSSPAPAGSTPPPTIAAQQVPINTATGPCHFPDTVSQDVVPTDVTWQLFGSTATPVSPTQGPQLTTGERSCYARSPAGALLAASGFVATLADPSSNKQYLYDQRMLHSTGYDTLAAKIANAPARADDSQSIWQITAFRFQAFTPDYAVVWIATRNTLNGGGGTGTLLTSPYVLQWADGDWKVVPPIDGGNLPSYQVPATSDLYTDFHGA